MSSVRLQDIRSIQKKELHFYSCMRNLKIKKTIPLTIPSKRIKYIGIKLTKEV